MTVRHFHVVLNSVGLIHIGNGKEYRKTDYFIDEGKLAVLDSKSFVSKLNHEQVDKFCNYLEDLTGKPRSETGLEAFLKTDPGLRALAKESVAYRVDASLHKARRGSYQFYDVQEFIKDPYGKPYIPGSSVKGMLRTALLGYLILRERERFFQLYEEIPRDQKRKKGRELEKEAFQRSESVCDTTFDINIMRYISVADSLPLSTSDLVFAKKYDKFSIDDDASHKKNMGRLSDDSYYAGNSLNIYRECLRPGTQIELTIDVDSRIDQYLGDLDLDVNGFRRILEDSQDLYERCFLRHFDLEGSHGAKSESAGKVDGRCRHVYQAGPLEGHRCRNQAIGDTGYCNMHQNVGQDASKGSEIKKAICYLGGGVDFDSKTVINALFEDDHERLDEIARILYGQFPTKVSTKLHQGLIDEIKDAMFIPQYMEPRYKGRRLIRGKDDHRHWKDIDLGVSPHTLKMGIWNNTTLPMGKCSFQIKEI